MFAHPVNAEAERRILKEGRIGRIGVACPIVGLDAALRVVEYMRHALIL